MYAYMNGFMFKDGIFFGSLMFQTWNYLPNDSIYLDCNTSILSYCSHPRRISIVNGKPPGGVDQKQRLEEVDGR